jgi:carboxypeptidase C (cathepsin A)
MVYIESPAGVGYSYVDGTEIPEYTDESSAEDNYLALKAFFAAGKFDELKDNDVYISGESYAGIYVPFLAHKILVEKKDTSIKLQGILVGNGVTDLKYDNDALWAMGFWHNVIDL